MVVDQPLPPQLPRTHYAATENLLDKTTRAVSWRVADQINYLNPGAPCGVNLRSAPDEAHGAPRSGPYETGATEHYTLIRRRRGSGMVQNAVEFAAERHKQNPSGRFAGCGSDFGYRLEPGISVAAKTTVSVDC